MPTSLAYLPDFFDAAIKIANRISIPPTNITAFRISSPEQLANIFTATTNANIPKEAFNSIFPAAFPNWPANFDTQIRPANRTSAAVINANALNISPVEHLANTFTARANTAIPADAFNSMFPAASILTLESLSVANIATKPIISPSRVTIVT